MILDGRQGDIERSRDVAITAAIDDSANNLELTCGQSIFLSRLAPYAAYGLGKILSGATAEHILATHDVVNCLQQLLRGRFFQDDTARAKLDR